MRLRAFPSLIKKPLQRLRKLDRHQMYSMRFNYQRILEYVLFLDQDLDKDLEPTISGNLMRILATLALRGLSGLPIILTIMFMTIIAFQDHYFTAKGCPCQHAGQTQRLPRKVHERIFIIFDKADKVHHNVLVAECFNIGFRCDYNEQVPFQK